MIKQTIRTHLDALLIPWAKEKGLPALPGYSLEEPPKNFGADLATNVAMLCAKQMKTNPRAIAQELSERIASSLSTYINKVEIAGAGFLNLHLADSFLHAEFASIREKKEAYGRDTGHAAERILLEFVSANPTGPLHIGHGRGAAIGDSLGRILSHRGYTVQREYYLNDVGNQMEVLGRSLETRYRQLKGEDIPFLENGYQGEYIKDIAKKLIDAGRPQAEIDFKKEALDAMMATIEQDLAGFEVKFDTWFSESVIAALRTPESGNKTQVELVCAWLLEKGFAFEQDGALWFATTRYGDDKDRVLRRSDGRYTYLASDVAYHKNKLGRGYHKLINLWGADHHGYVARMKAAITALGSNPDTLEIILYQLVSLVRNGVPVAMSTRAGEFVTLEEVLKEVGKDACRFFFMLRAPDSPLEFDLELAKKQSSENPVFYVQYVHARCNSIFREYRTRNATETVVSGTPDFSLLSTKEERELMKKLISFADTLDLCIKTNSPHHLTAWLMETADLFHRFYEHCRVLGDDAALTNSRLALVESVAVSIRNGLSLLGVSAPERM